MNHNFQYLEKAHNKFSYWASHNFKNCNLESRFIEDKEIMNDYSLYVSIYVNGYAWRNLISFKYYPQGENGFVYDIESIIRGHHSSVHTNDFNRALNIFMQYEYNAYSGIFSTEQDSSAKWPEYECNTDYGSGDISAKMPYTSYNPNENESVDSYKNAG